MSSLIMIYDCDPIPYPESLDDELWIYSKKNIEEIKKFTCVKNGDGKLFWRKEQV